MTLKTLQLEAKKLGLKGYSKLNKSELEQAVNRAKREKARQEKEEAKKRVPIPTSLEEAQATLGRLSKGEARKLRKLLHKRGRTDLAAATRIVG